MSDRSRSKNRSDSPSRPRKRRKHSLCRYRTRHRENRSSNIVLEAIVSRLSAIEDRLTASVSQAEQQRPTH